MKPRCFILICLALAGLSFGAVQWWQSRQAVKDRASSMPATSPNQRTVDQAIGAAHEMARQADRLTPQIVALDKPLAHNSQQLAVAQRATATATQRYEQTNAQPVLPVDLVGADRADAIRRTCAKLAACGIHCEPAHR